MADHHRQALIVDDDPDVRAALEFVLASAYEVRGAGDSAEAFELLDSLPHLDIVLVDIRMPGLRGVEFASMLADLRPDIGIVVMSGQERPREGELPARVPFLQKPCFPHEVLEAVDQACRARDGEDISGRATRPIDGFA